MIPMLIGSQARPLHAIYTAAAGRRRRRAVVFCPPFRDEGTNAHRTGRVLAQRLAASGAEALRFDYFGSGESAGDDEELSVGSAVEDALTAVDEALALAKVRHVTLVGLRAGALVAALAAPRARAVDRLVLWEPVVDDYELTALPPRTLLLVAADSPEHRQLREHLAALPNGANVQFEIMPCTPPWVATSDDGVGPAPPDVLARIAGWDT